MPLSVPLKVGQLNAVSSVMECVLCIHKSLGSVPAHPPKSNCCNNLAMNLQEKRKLSTCLSAQETHKMRPWRAGEEETSASRTARASGPPSGEPVTAGSAPWEGGLPPGSRAAREGGSDKAPAGLCFLLCRYRCSLQGAGFHQRTSEIPFSKYARDGLFVVAGVNLPLALTITS